MYIYIICIYIYIYVYTYIYIYPAIQEAGESPPNQKWPTCLPIAGCFPRVHQVQCCHDGLPTRLGASFARSDTGRLPFDFPSNFSTFIGIQHFQLPSWRGANHPYDFPMTRTLLAIVSYLAGRTSGKAKTEAARPEQLKLPKQQLSEQISGFATCAQNRRPQKPKKQHILHARDPSEARLGAGSRWHLALELLAEMAGAPWAPRFGAGRIETSRFLVTDGVWGILLPKWDKDTMCIYIYICTYTPESHIYIYIYI